MGGQHFAAGPVHVDLRALNRILALDSDAGRSMPATLASEPSSQPSVASVLRSGSGASGIATIRDLFGLTVKPSA
jgi:hypothetical protein